MITTSALLLWFAMTTSNVSHAKPHLGTAIVKHQKPHHRLKGIASWYGKKFKGRKTASGARFNPNALTAAHRTLPLNTRVKVINLENKRSVIVTINDRGPFVKGRIIDLSRRAAEVLDLREKGLGKVKIVALQ
jgi:rare lipoprotein A